MKNILSHDSQMSYKPEIDGLRTIAVMLVLLCHMQLGVAGGFIGVDIFFVISGFLITYTLLENAQQRQYSFINFYAKRFLRLYPALICTLVISVAIAVLLFDPLFLKLTAYSAKYAILSASNILFTRSGQGYFDPTSSLQPFLHTWSLGVEWQFYLIWPALIWGLLFRAKSNRWLVMVLVFITLASLIASQWAITHSPNAAYYQMPYRAFELSIGALLVFVYNKKIPYLANLLLFITGLLTIVLCAWFYSAQTPFPGVYALIPCLATAACIYSSQHIVKGNFLRWPTMVYLGKASYSIYLVHWPLIVYYQYYIYSSHLSLIEKITLFLLSIVLGILSYMGIEKHWRWKKLRHPLRTCAVIAVVVLACIPIFNLINKDSDGLPWRIPQNPYAQDIYTRWAGSAYKRNDTNIIGDTQQPPIAILMGDSIAGSFAGGLDPILKQNKQAMTVIFEFGCFISTSPQGTPACKETSQKALDVAKTQKLPLILSQSWGSAFSDTFMLPHQEGRTQSQYHEELRQQLDNIKAAIVDSPLIILGQPLFRRLGGGDQGCLTRPTYVYRACERQLAPYQPNELAMYQTNRFLQDYAQQHPGVYYIDIQEKVCPNGLCTMQRNAALFFDSYHLSVYGSDLLAPDLFEQIQLILNQPAHGKAPASGQQQYN